MSEKIGDFAPSGVRLAMCEALEDWLPKSEKRLFPASAMQPVFVALKNKLDELGYEIVKRKEKL